MNRTAQDVVYLEIGDRSAGDQATYPDDDLKAEAMPGGGWRFTGKDGSGYGEK